MRTTIALLASLAALAVAAPAGTATHTVSITKVGFAPNNLSVAAGDAVTWTNLDTATHQVVSQDAGFSSPILQPSQTYTFTFTKAGRFTVVDSQSKNEKMTVTVTAAAESVSLNGAPRVLTYGGKSALSGTLSSQASGEQLTIEQQQCGASAFSKLTTVTTTTGGAFTYAAQPLKNTAYQVRYKNATSSQLTVRVRPRITLGKIAPRRFTVRVRAADSFAGKSVAVQRFNAATRRWVLARYTVLRAGTGAVAPTVASSVTFTLKVPARTKLRVAMGSATAGSCYAASVSNAVLA
jgi:plastocyanin